MVAQYMNPEIHRAVRDEDVQKCLDVRVKVFVDEQKYPLHTETDDHKYPDNVQWLATCERADTKERVPVGVIRLLVKENGVAKLGRLAVLSDARGMQLGRKLVLAFIEGAKEMGYSSIVLEAQIDKRGFYEKLGFVVEKGDEEPYPVDGTPHVKMWMRSLE
ncbi:acyl-CoA N-acyltransferase [Fennellomyces sp. T-0311]|nr:acyl-CoA N-acyltransferase [Fennellomyces sp. T-0311]